MTTPKLAIAELSTAQAGKEITVNQALRDLDQIVNCGVLDKDLATPPGSPADGAAYIVGASPTGAWAGMAGNIAYWYASTAAWTFKIPRAGWWAWVADENLRYEFKAGAWVPLVVSGSQCIPVACSDETTALTTGAGKVVFHMPYDFILQEVFAGLTTPQTSGSIFTVDVNMAGTSVISTKINIDNTEETSLTAATPPVIATATLTKGSKITVDIDQIGDGTAKGLKVYLIGVKA